VSAHQPAVPLRTAQPVPITRLTPARLAGMKRVHALDPARGGPGMTLAIPGRGWLPDGPGRALVVHIDVAWAAADLAALRAVIAAAAGRTG
jgi:hypothetical protein